MIFNDHTMEILDRNKPETWTIDSVPLRVFTFAYNNYDDWDFAFVLSRNLKEAVDVFIVWCNKTYSYYEQRTFQFEDNEDTVIVTLNGDEREYQIIDHGEVVANQVYG